MRYVQSTLFALLAASSTAFANSSMSSLNLTEGVSPISHDVYQLHMMLFWICVVIIQELEHCASAPVCSIPSAVSGAYAVSMCRFVPWCVDTEPVAVVFAERA